MKIWPEITKDTPLEEIQRIHKEIWDYIITNGYKPTTPYLSNCALCAYAHSIMQDREETYDEQCRCCPSEFMFENDGIPPCLGGLYDLYRDHDGKYWIPRKQNIKVVELIRDIKFVSQDKMDERIAEIKRQFS